MAWDLEHQEQLGVEDGDQRPKLRSLPHARRLMVYASLALVPVAIFALMLLMAR
jgi:hypothetical protein